MIQLTESELRRLGELRRHRRDAQIVTFVASALRRAGNESRLVLLTEFAENGELSPAALTRKLKATWAKSELKNVARHVDALAGAGLVRQTRTRKVRGATEHFYELTELGRATHAAAAVVQAQVEREADDRRWPHMPRP